jgi:hypothetical protein
MASALNPTQKRLQAIVAELSRFGSPVPTGKIIATQFAIILRITGDVVTRFQMPEDSFDVSKAAGT